jgi:F0F1-type ATP synthase gamma subunit
MEKDIDIMMELLKNKKIIEAKNIEKEIYNKYKKEDNEELYIKYKEYFEFFKFECDRLEILEKVDNIITLI